ncbi:hypothetical protein QWY77_07350 [Thalassotalea ponticola]|uniref:hypothetical protein n=1 Tax=Thalassotalea ponticola TaxID=1523392 RepID=UPI0025B5944A|nr:hypothetical protein [Thalassotalea ponticola]MDN3652580.1 hypothetical protein [Thalassotalea ponticola]
MTNRQKVISKYLHSYAEREVSLLSSFDGTSIQPFEHVIVIPAFKESDDFVHRFFRSALAQQRTLMVVVVNQPQSVSGSKPQRELFDSCSMLGEEVFHNDSIRLIEVADTHSAILLVDRFSDPIANNQGVGLARKIGCDLAVEMIAKGLIKNRFIHSTDADATLPENYFVAATQASDSVVALGFDFKHQCDDVLVHRANSLYEQALRYYVKGLQQAGSRYAFFTIGSTLAFDCLAYCQCRGFPKRSAGEDFYLVNKLVKLGDYHFADEVVIQLQARKSDRVPFGTGPAVIKIIELMATGQDYHYYHPKVFVELGLVLSAFTNLYSHRQQLDNWYSQLSSTTAQTLRDIGLSDFVLSQSSVTEVQFTKQLHNYFDAFKTLKFIHGLRCSAYPDVPFDH